ncbi:hypothetical protein HI914_04012 [Erysiphe necator]|nr:hypothetical protein HI914_04012 [Erysiphe necator]
MLDLSLVALKLKVHQKLITMYIEFASQRNITRNQVVIHVNSKYPLRIHFNRRIMMAISPYTLNLAAILVIELLK